jgi:hypothetical protein
VSSKGKGRNRSHRLRQGVARWLEVPPGEPLWPVSRRPSEFRPTTSTRLYRSDSVNFLSWSREPSKPVLIHCSPFSN